ncbi:MAG: hypothetical protein VW378_02265 [bacterium]
MTLENHIKAKVIVSVLGNQAEAVLKHMRQDTLTRLLKIEQPPMPSQKELNQLIAEFIEEVDHITLEQPEDMSLIQEDNFLNDIEEEEEEEKTSEEDDDLLEVADSHPDRSQRSYSEIAEILKNEQVQTIAFFLTKLDLQEQENILKHYSENEKSRILNTKVKNTPLDESIFNALYMQFYENDEIEVGSKEESNNREESYQNKERKDSFQSTTELNKLTETKNMQSIKGTNEELIENSIEEDLFEENDFLDADPISLESLDEEFDLTTTST